MNFRIILAVLAGWAFACGEDGNRQKFTELHPTYHELALELHKTEEDSTEALREFEYWFDRFMKDRPFKKDYGPSSLALALDKFRDHVVSALLETAEHLVDSLGTQQLFSPLIVAAMTSKAQAAEIDNISTEDWLLGYGIHILRKARLERPNILTKEDISKHLTLSLMQPFGPDMPIDEGQRLYCYLQSISFAKKFNATLNEKQKLYLETNALLLMQSLSSEQVALYRDLKNYRDYLNGE